MPQRERRAPGVTPIQPGVSGEEAGEEAREEAREVNGSTMCV